MSAPGTFDHLDRLSDERGLFEHAKGDERREEHGYCTDDNARLLVVSSREPDVGFPRRLSRLALSVVRGAQLADGRCHNRMDIRGRWTDDASTDDCWGRSLWGLGAAASHHAVATVRRIALDGFDLGARQRSPWARSMAFAALGAADVLANDPDHGSARAICADALQVIGEVPPGAWAWPEPRLRYANAALAEAVMAAGAALNSAPDLNRGLRMLGWLLDLETRSGHLSVCGANGRGPDDHSPQFDQQPIEVAALADACWRAYTLTGDGTWSHGVTLAADWFRGINDAGFPMYDEQSGGGYDGLHADRVNLNQGAESTLALVSTMQRARSFAPVS